jgi:bifunctional non-homologous end joining protein LigD
MLAKEADEPFDDQNWLYEIKWDGYRSIAEVNNGDVRLYSRNGNTFENSYSIVVNELKKIKANAIIDGEIVVLNDDGHPEFQLLQHYEENTHRPIQFYAFDILSLNGRNTCELPLIERKELLHEIIPKNEVIKYSDHILEQGIAFFNASKEKNLEGILAKKSDSHYYIGKRTNEWLKIKNHKTQEAIICGYTDPGGARKYFGALVLGVKDENQSGKLKYIGHTGSGFNQRSLKEMWDLLQPLKQSNSPFEEKVKTNMPVTWVKPKLVCEMKFTEITRDGILRHPIFLHLREDKPIKEVTMANTKTVKKTVPIAIGIKKIDKGERVLEDPENDNDRIFTFGKIKVKATNINKIYFPDEGITKGDVINYYIEMADYILPYLKGRPQSLLRNPNGIKAKGFFHKDTGEDAPSFVKTKKIYSESTNKDINYIICDNKPTLTYLNNLGSIEINPWHSTVEALDNPDYLMIDIDPSDENTFEQVIEAANVVKEVLDKAGAPSYCKTSGASGLHIYVPTAKRYTYEQVKDFTYLICMLANEQIPAFTTLERNLQKRGRKHIYMDYLQNRRGQTIACVYSLRPKPGATVSTPLLWKEVTRGLTPQDFNIKNIMKRVKKSGDIFIPILGKGIDLNKCLKKLGG